MGSREAWLSTLFSILAITQPKNSAEVLEILTMVKTPAAPNNFSAVELVIRKTKSLIYELAWLLSDIYKGAGFEEPFAKIAKNQAGKEE